MPGASQELRDVLRDAQRVGLLGPGDVEAHVRHSEAFARVVESLLEDASHLFHRRQLADLGSGGGVPAFVIAGRLGVSSRSVLIEGSQRRAAFLDEAARGLGLSDLVEVVDGRAEEVGRRVELRGTFDLVTARAFGRPAVTAECAAPLLRVGGHLVVSEPPGLSLRPAREREQSETPLASSGDEPEPDRAATRWPVEGLARLGLEMVGARLEDGLSFVVLRQVELCPPAFPRRIGIPEKRPLF